MYRMYGMTQGAMEGGAAMYRMYGMSRCHGWQGVTNVQDVRTDICCSTIAPALLYYSPSMWVKASRDDM